MAKYSELLDDYIVPTFNSKKDFIAYLESTLIPDLCESGHECTAKDFEEAIFWMKNTLSI